MAKLLNVTSNKITLYNRFGLGGVITDETALIDGSDGKIPPLTKHNPIALISQHAGNVHGSLEHQSGGKRKRSSKKKKSLTKRKKNKSLTKKKRSLSNSRKKKKSYSKL